MKFSDIMLEVHVVAHNRFFHSIVTNSKLNHLRFFELFMPKILIY